MKNLSLFIVSLFCIPLYSQPVSGEIQGECFILVNNAFLSDIDILWVDNIHEADVVVTVVDSDCRLSFPNSVCFKSPKDKSECYEPTVRARVVKHDSGYKCVRFYNNIENRPLSGEDMYNFRKIFYIR